MNLPTWLTDNSSENAESTGGLERLLVSGLQEASLPVAISQSEALRDRFRESQTG